MATADQPLKTKPPKMSLAARTVVSLAEESDRALTKTYRSLGWLSEFELLFTPTISKLAAKHTICISYGALSLLGRLQTGLSQSVRAGLPVRTEHEVGFQSELEGNMAGNIDGPSTDVPEKLRAGELRRRRLRFINTLLFRTPGGLRFTQDSPILPSVWIDFAMDPQSQQELILTVGRDGGTGRAAYQLRSMLSWLRKRRPYIGQPADESGVDGQHKRQRARVSYIPGQIAAKLYFDELMRVVLPLTPWWHDIYDRLRKLERDERNRNESFATDWRPFPQPDPNGHRESDLTRALMLMRWESDPGSDYQLRERVEPYIKGIPPELSWLVRISGLIGDCFATGEELLGVTNGLGDRMWRELDPDDDPLSERIVTTEELREARTRSKVERDRRIASMTREGIVSAFVGLYDNWSEDDAYPGKDDRLIWRVTKNRPVHLAVQKSALTVKADAARRLFEISCKDITWAIVDSGIDRKHPAFCRLSEEETERVRLEYKKEAIAEAKEKRMPHDAARAHVQRGADRRVKVNDLGSRVKMTLDFTKLRKLLDFDIESQEDEEKNNVDEEAEKRRYEILAEIRRRMNLSDEAYEQRCEALALEGGEAETPEQEVLCNLRNRIRSGKEISWQDLELAIIDNNPIMPTNDHGTHVAGILAADWVEDFAHESNLPPEARTRRMQGICPDINLIDVRVYRDDGLTDEFELLAAIQYLRWMNTRAGMMEVHGANISLSLVHEVQKFACGQTPICDECNEASALGMVVVAAAGNRGFEVTDPEKVRLSDGYRDTSITDPGNAASVITVGATHRKRPHEYGVSYFSSRGPTGDGRLKPDIIAPGEKIHGPIPDERSEFKDGTSMAAPHVSGAAAMLMARHTELIAQPERIKQVLCETATDLGRERYFQGHGLVDVLRALQSV